MDTLVIAEKPSVALRMAIALGDGRQKRMSHNSVSYYEIDNPDGKIYIAPAVGHIFSLVQSVRKSGYPVLDIKWAPAHESNKKAEFTKKYLDVLKELAKKSQSYINACDFDTEGTVIGTNIIKYATKDGLSHAKRMKFSTTTVPDIKDAYAHLMPLDINNFYAGEARHMLDWLWGINFSRALTSAIFIPGPKRRALSIGRVQGPALALLAVREKEIAAFTPVPFWKLFITVRGIEFSNTRGEIFEHEAAKKAHEETIAAQKAAKVNLIDAREQLSRPNPPFDLTSLQIEASRTLRYDPSATLAIAQSLYERSYISYPRTSSQKLPSTLGLNKVIEELAKNPKYAARANTLIKGKMFKPMEGAKQDEAHPAIYPTGVRPEGLESQEEALYNLVTERFLACFAPNAKLARTKVVVKAGGESYSADGTKIIEKGWLDFYKFATLGEKELPEFKKDENVDISKTEIRESKTAPPKRYGKASLIAELERRDLGTKATRAAIMDTLFRREYIAGSPINVTEFGMSIYETLHDNVLMITEEETTRKLEQDMELISQGKKTEEEVIKEGKDMLLAALKQFDSNKAKIKEALSKGLALNSQAILGKCPKDGGDLVIRKSRVGKQFAACTNYPNCTNTYSVPQGALIASTGKTCDLCHTPIIKVIRRGKAPFEMDLDQTCRSKESISGQIPQVVRMDNQAKEIIPIKVEAPVTTTTEVQIGAAPVKKARKAKPKATKPATDKKVKKAKKE
jgi:DNA topoisomerase-1